MAFIMFPFNLAIWIYAAKAFKHTGAKEKRYHHLNYSHHAHLATCLNIDDFQETAREGLNKNRELLKKP